MDKSLIVALLLLPTVALAQTHTMPGSNVVPSGASLTIQSGGSITAAAGSTVTGFGAPNTSGSSILYGNGSGGFSNATVSTGLTFTGGTLSVTAGTYQAADTDLTTWAGITPVAAVGTWIATPSSANLRSAMTDENGTGALLFSGATTPDFTTGFTIGAAAASGKIPIGNGTNYVPSTPTYPNAASTALKWLRSDGTNFITSTATQSDSPGTAGKVMQSDGTNWVTSTPTFPTAAGTLGYLIRSDGTNFTSYPNQQTNSSVTNQSFTTSDTYLTNSSCVVAAGDFKAKGQYRCVFDLVKSAGTGAIVISVRIGTAGTTSDTAQLTFTFGSGTSVADSGVFDVVVNWRSVGSGTSAVVQGICRGTHNLATTGLFNNAAGWVIIGTPSGGFNSSAATTIGLSVNGSTAFAGTNSLTQAQLQQ